MKRRGKQYKACYCCGEKNVRRKGATCPTCYKVAQVDFANVNRVFGKFMMDYYLKGEATVTTEDFEMLKNNRVKKKIDFILNDWFGEDDEQQDT